MLVLCKKAIFSYCCHSSANIIGAITKCCGLQLGCPLQCSPDLSELMLPQVLVKSKASQAPPRYPDLLHQIFMGEAWWSPTARPGFRCFAWISGVSLYLVLVFQSWQRKPSLLMQAFHMVFSQHVWHFPTLQGQERTSSCKEAWCCCLCDLAHPALFLSLGAICS